MLFGVYFHIPYCIQRCTYCDFATYEQSQILPPDSYTQLVIKEIALKKRLFLGGSTTREINTIYFGGGTPSLFSIENIVLLLEALSREGFYRSPDAELTIEINPGTVNERKLNQYLELGFNRFSLGAQTFNQNHLKRVHREHSVEQTLESLDLFRRYKLNFNFDILFGLPFQNVEELKEDILRAVCLGSTHISPYYLTVPEGHPLSKNRPPEDAQISMFETIDRELTHSGYFRYELSNYAKPGFESKHNMLYWTDQEYAGFGLSSHSYVKQSFENSTPWGSRFWNPNNIKIYENEIREQSSQNDFCFISPKELPKKYFEVLAENQSLTDFCHTSLRIARGIDLSQLEAKFSNTFYQQALSSFRKLTAGGLLIETPMGFSLSNNGKMISNFVFQKLTF